MEFINAIKMRRSVRKFRPDEIPDVIMDELLEAVRLAPSPGNSQNCCVGVISDHEQKRRLAEAAGGQEWIAGAPVVFALCSRIEPDMESRPEDDMGLEVNRLRFGREFIKHMSACPDKKAADTFWINANPMIPGEHIFLAAVNRGLGACWIGMLDVEEAGRILELPGDMVCLYLMPVGFPAEEPEEKKRKSLNEIVFRDRWALGKNK